MHDRPPGIPHAAPQPKAAQPELRVARPAERTAHLWLAGAASAAGLLYDPLAPAVDAKRAALLLVGVVALAAGALRQPPRMQRTIPTAALLWLALVGWLTLSALPNLTLALRPLGTWLGGTAVLLFALQLPRAHLRQAARLVAVALGGAAALGAVVEYGTGARGLYVHGGQGNPNWLGLLLAMTLPLALEQAWRYRRQRQLAVALAALGALQVVGLYLSHSRVAWAAVTIAGLVASWSALPRQAGARAALAIGLFLAVVAAPGSGGAAPEPAAEPAAVATETPDAPLPTAWAGRVWIWQSSLRAAAYALPLGVGLGGFAAAYLDAQGQRLAGLSPRQAARRFLNATTAHNDWLEVTVEGGPIALGLLLAMLLGADPWARRRGSWRAGSAVLVTCAVCATGDSPLQQPAIVGLLVLVLAASPRRVNLGRLGGQLPVLRWTVLLGAALLLAPATSTWLGARLASRARAADPAERAVWLARAARIDPRSGEIALERGLDALLLGDAAGALPELLRSQPLLANLGTDVAIGNAELLLGHPAAAAAAYERALLRHPGSFRAHANLALARSQLGAQEQALAHLATARALQPGHPKLAELAQRITEPTR